MWNSSALPMPAEIGRTAGRALIVGGAALAITLLGALLDHEQLAELCVSARRKFYGWPSIGKRLKHWVNLRDPLMAFYFLVINGMHQVDVGGRQGLPLGDAGAESTLLECA